MRGQPGHNARTHARLPPKILGMDDLITKRIFDSQDTWAIDVFGLLLTRYPLVFVQPGTARRSVDWCRNWMSVLHIAHYPSFLLPATTPQVEY